MFKISLSISNFSTIDIYTSCNNIKDSIIDNISKIQKTIPVTNMYVTISDCDKLNSNYVIIENGKTKTFTYNKISNVAYIQLVNDNLRIPDLIYTLLTMFCSELINDRKYLLHSSALKYDDDKAIVLIGDANSGKSTLAYNLIQNHDMQLISNDHTLLGIDNDLLKTFGGTKIIELRYGTVVTYFKDLINEIGDINCSDIWSKKLIVNDYFDSSLIASEKLCHVTDIFQISLNQKGNTFIKEKEYIDQRLYLYEQLSKIIKGTYNMIVGFDYPMPSLESESILVNLDLDIRKSLQNTHVHICQGSLNDLSKSMVKTIAKK